jgi:hypothetical protein
MHIPENSKDKILSASEGRLLEVIEDFIPLQKKGKDYIGVCPKCQKEKALTVSPSKNIYKCFKGCDFSGNSAVSFLMDHKDFKYPEALKYLADRFNIIIEDEKPLPVPKTKKKTKESFCDRQLKSSGLKPADVLAKIKEDEEQKIPKEINPFISATLDQYFNIDYKGDDLIIRYYDLDGKPTMYRTFKGAERPLYRIRWQNPELHKDKDGRPIKYQSPFGSGSHLYIPEKLRKKYASKQAIETLFVQEGEKKAEKACKHGLMSVGIMGIHNLAGKNKPLPQEFERIVRECDVKRVVFLLDLDWDHLSSNIKSGDRIDTRARSFMSAIIKFKDYFKAFYNEGINLEIYFGHVKPNEKNNKGIDDLLTFTLSGKEADFSKEIDQVWNTKLLDTDFVRFHKITTWTDQKFEHLFCLQSAPDFAKKHKDRLLKIPEFKIGKHLWRFNEKGEFESAQPLAEDEIYWTINRRIDKSDNVKTTESFDYVNCFNFLKRRGFGRILMASGSFDFVHMEKRVVKKVDPYQIRDFVTGFTKEIAPKAIQNMLYRGGPQYLGQEKLSNLDFVFPQFEKSTRTSQFMYFNEKVWEITPDKIDEKELEKIPHHIWQDELIKYKVERSKQLLNVTRVDDTYIQSIDEKYRKDLGKFKGKFIVELTEAGKKSHFLRFLENTSNFTWRKPEGEVSFEEQFENNQHFIAKLSAFGYMLHKYRDSSNAKAIVCMDGKLSEVGTSNGRSGKSVYAKALGKLLLQEEIPAKNKNITDDIFLLTEVTEKTRNIFLDDIRANLDFEFFFPIITGKIKINVKGGGRFTLPEDHTPKLILTTNHAIRGEGSSFRDRQWFVAFSDYYNDEKKPIDDFKVSFWDEWDSTQWNLFYNFAAEALQVWLKYGMIESPSDIIEMRRLRQEMSEDLLSWGEEYFSPLVGEDEREINLNKRIEKRELYDDFVDKYPIQRKYVTMTTFKTRLKKFCEYKGYIFNPNMYDPVTKVPMKFDKKDSHPITDDKTGGKEYITIGNEKFYETI